MAEESVQTQRAIQHVMLHSEAPSPFAPLWLRTSGGLALMILLPGNRERKGKAMNASRLVNFPASGLGLTRVSNLPRLQNGGGFPLSGLCPWSTCIVSCCVCRRLSDIVYLLPILKIFRDEVIAFTLCGGRGGSGRLN